MAIPRASAFQWFAPLRSRQTRTDTHDVCRTSPLLNIRFCGEILRSRRPFPVAIQVNQHVDSAGRPRGDPPAKIAGWYPRQLLNGYSSQRIYDFRTSTHLTSRPPAPTLGFKSLGQFIVGRFSIEHA